MKKINLNYIFICFLLFGASHLYAQKDTTQTSAKKDSLAKKTIL